MKISSDISERVEIFSVFRHALSRLSLNFCHITTPALVTLLNYFSSLDRVDLVYIIDEVDNRPTPPLSHPKIREIHISENYTYISFLRSSVGIFNQLSELGLQVDEVVVDGGELSAPLSRLGRITDTFGVNARRLGLLQPLGKRVYIS